MSWNSFEYEGWRWWIRQPLREAVSWNRLIHLCKNIIRVSLFVRLWVEIIQRLILLDCKQSASSWGCELKYFILFHNALLSMVSLFVRLWVEITILSSSFITYSSASSWGCELKYAMNNGMLTGFKSASSWGCELKSSDADPFYADTTVSLFVRLWVEMKIPK